MSTTTDDQFLRQVVDAMATADGSELAARIAALHHQAVNEEVTRLQKDVSDARDQAAQTAAAASLQWHHNGPLLEMLQHLIRRRGEAGARVAHMATQLGHVAKLCADADGAGGMVSATILKKVIAHTAPAVRWVPATVSFLPSQAYRLGYFKTEDAAVVRALPFVGYALHEDTPDKIPQPHTAFLVDGQVKARPQIQRELGLVLSHLE